MKHRRSCIPGLIAFVMCLPVLAMERDVATGPKAVHIFAGSYSLSAKFLFSYDAKVDADGKYERRMQILTASPNLPKMGLSNAPIESLVWDEDGKHALATGTFTAKGVTFTMQMEYDATGNGKARVTLIPAGKPPVTSVWLKADVNDFAPPKE